MLYLMPLAAVLLLEFCSNTLAQKTRA